MFPSFRDAVLSHKKIVLADEHFAVIPERGHERARENEKNIAAYDFEYLVNGRKYNGFYARLKNLPEGKKPVIILNRGGSGLFGTIDARQIYSGFVLPVIEAGYIVIGSQCMGFADDGAKDEMGGTDFESILELKKFIDADDEADADRIGYYCASRGAIATFRLLAERGWAKAAVVISGVIDQIDNEAYRDDMKEHHKKMYGGSVEESRKRSVLYWPDKISKTTPILMMYGTSDWRVNPKLALTLSEKFIDLKVPHRLVMFEGNDHFLKEAWKESRKISIEWLDRYVRNGESLPDLEKHGA
jgi:dipeptidyl aminopeptidase/acylaminoacyl peptidase